jgi:DNA (cytosine-5)-methyltransferase 1
MWVLAYSNNNGDIAAKESRSTSQGSDSSQTRQEPTSEPSGLCASRADGGMEGESKVLAYTSQQGLEGLDWESIPKQTEQPREGHNWAKDISYWHTDPAEGPTEPIVGRVANGVANRVDRLKAIGNGQVPQCAAMAFSILSEGLI